MNRRSRTTALRHSPWLALLILAISILVLTTCGSDDPVDVPPDNNGIIGPAGGTVTDAGGAGVTIPADALTEDVAITVKTFVDPETGPYPTGPVPIFWGGAQFGPAGTQFSKPVSITLPTRAPLNPGDGYQLFAYDPDNQRWVIEKGAAIVAPGGQALEAEVSHFSVFNGGGNVGGGQARSDITAMLCAFGSAEAVCNAYVAYFRKYIADVGDKGVYDLECKEVCGLDMYVTCEINGDNFFLSYRNGELVGNQVMIYDPDNCAVGDDNAMLETISNIYYRCAQPDLAASADPGEIELGGSSTVIASLTCGQMVFPGQPVEFECVGVGQIDRTSATTNAAGQAQAMYTNDELEGEATVTAYFDACAGQTNEGTVTDEAVITTTTAGPWSGRMLVMFSQTIGGAPLFNFSDVVTIEFNLSISEMNIISGTGTGTHVPFVTAGEDCWVSSVSAPSFAVTIVGTATAETMNFVVYPNPMIPLSFVITCPQGEDDTTDYPYPMVEGLLEGSILSQDIMISVDRVDGGEDSNSGSRSEGTDIPMEYSYEVTVNK
jgi:hypothetical protein